MTTSSSASTRSTASQLAIDQANKDNTFGFKLTLLKADDVGDPPRLRPRRRVLQQDPPWSACRPAFSGASKAVGKKPTATPASRSSPRRPPTATLQDQGFKTFHRVIPTTTLEGPAAADWLAKKAKKVFVVNDKSAYGEGVADAVAGELKAKGVTVTRRVSTDDDQGLRPDRADGQAVRCRRAVLRRLRRPGCPVRQGLKAVGYNGLRMTGNGVQVAGVHRRRRPAGDGWYFSCGCLDATVAPAAKDFAAAYQAKFNTPPSTYSPEAFDADERACSGDQGRPRTPARRPVQAVDDAVNELDYKGITDGDQVRRRTVTCAGCRNGQPVPAVKGGKIVMPRRHHAGQLTDPFRQHV